MMKAIIYVSSWLVPMLLSQGYMSPSRCPNSWESLLPQNFPSIIFPPKPEGSTWRHLRLSQGAWRDINWSLNRFSAESGKKPASDGPAKFRIASKPYRDVKFTLSILSEVYLILAGRSRRQWVMGPPFGPYPANRAHHQNFGPHRPTHHTQGNISCPAGTNNLGCANNQ